MSEFVLVIISQLGRNRFESPSLPDSKNLTEQRQRRVTSWKLDGYDDDIHITTPAMVTIAYY